jgi:hypothetical protein
MAFFWEICKTQQSLFVGSLPRDNISNICYLCHFVDEWASLQKETKHEAFRQGSEILVEVAV